MGGAQVDPEVREARCREDCLREGRLICSLPVWLASAAGFVCALSLPEPGTVDSLVQEGGAALGTRLCCCVCWHGASASWRGASSVFLGGCSHRVELIPVVGLLTCREV